MVSRQGSRSWSCVWDWDWDWEDWTASCMASTRNLHTGCLNWDKMADMVSPLASAMACNCKKNGINHLNIHVYQTFINILVKTHTLAYEINMQRFINKLWSKEGWDTGWMTWSSFSSPQMPVKAWREKTTEIKLESKMHVCKSLYSLERKSKHKSMIFQRIWLTIMRNHPFKISLVRSVLFKHKNIANSQINSKLELSLFQRGYKEVQKKSWSK